MARIKQEIIEKLKNEVSLVRLLESQGFKLKKHGKDFICHCPFHDDKTPSLVVSPDKNLWNCLGACGTGGSVIDWVMKREGISFRRAVEILQHDIGVISEVHQPVKQSTTKQLTSSLVAEKDEQQALNQVMVFYHETLRESPEALQYLESRGLNHPDLINTFKLGYANRTLAYRLPEKNRKAGAEIRGRLQNVGILRKSGHEHFNGSVVVPIFDNKQNEDNQIVEVYGRKILGNRLRKGTPQHTYLPGPHAGVWNAQGFTNQKEIILCESLIDAMTFWVNGFKNVTASYGTSGFTKDHLALFKCLNIERVLIAYDRDEAGNTAAEKLAKKLNQENIECYRVLFPKNMDANEYALEVKPASKSLGVVIRSAELIGEIMERDAGSVTLGKDSKQESETAKKEKLVTEKSPSLVAEKISEASLPASVKPPSPVEVIEPEISEHEIKVSYGNRHYRIRGLQKNTCYEVLKVNVLAKIDESIHVDTFDLYSAKHRQGFAKLAAIESSVELKLIQRDLGQLLLQLEKLQDKAIQEALKPNEPTAYTMDEVERKNALELLNDPNLTARIINDFNQTGLVGEPTNALMGYLATVSRKLKTPLAIIVQSTSAAGKSALMDAVLKLVPEEDRVHYSAMTGQSLFYLGETNLKHKILAISEEEGVRQAAYALKLLQSQGELTIASTGKDPQSGKMVTEEYKVEGPVMLFLTTTAIDIDEELLNRCVVLTINESREQTAAIQQKQRQARTLKGLLSNHQNDHLIKQHQNAQRLLRPLAVVNPYAEQLHFADSQTRTRRDHEKYLTLIETITLLHQYQRKVKTANADNGDQPIEYIEVTLDDIALANELAHEILGRSLDELPPPTRGLLKQLYALVADKIKTESLRQNEVRFTRREVREAIGLSDKQVRVHLDRLVEMEYVLAHHGRNGQKFIYELVFDGEVESNQPQLIGLIDVDKLKQPTKNNVKACPATEASAVGTTDDLVVSKDNLVPSLWSASGQVVASLCMDKNTAKANGNKGLKLNDVDDDIKSTKAVKNTDNRSNANRTNTSSLFTQSTRSAHGADPAAGV